MSATTIQDRGAAAIRPIGSFLVSVMIGPTVLPTLPFCAIIVFLINQLLIQLGATDVAGAGLVSALYLQFR